MTETQFPRFLNKRHESHDPKEVTKLSAIGQEGIVQAFKPCHDFEVWMDIQS